MRYFPIFVDTAEQTVLVVGGNEQAAQKLRLLRKTEAQLRVVAPEVVPEIADLARHHRLEWLARPFAEEDLEQCRLVYAAADDDDTLLAFVSRSARARNIPVNIVDRPELSTFITPAIVDRDPIVCAIGSEGTAPVLVRRIRESLENLLPSGLGRVARRAGELRPWLATRLKSSRDRRRFWDGFFDGPVAQQILNGDSNDLTAALEANLDQAEKAGRVLLVGAGPGDPDLLTLKAMRALQTADVIVYDRLVGPGILERARRDAERIDVGKRPGRPSPRQSDICAILVEQARQGKTVLRLKGGDPLVFGRAGEEVSALRDAGIAFEIIPGITAALAAAAVAKTTLTERLDRRRLTFLTGHATDGPASHDWHALARPGQALAIYMGVGAAAHIQGNLLAHGADADTRITIVENATLPSEKIASGRLVGLTELVIDHAIKGPAMIFIGTAPEAAIERVTETSATTLPPRADAAMGAWT